MRVSPRTDFYYWRKFATGLSFTTFGIGGLMLGYMVFPLVWLFSASPAKARRRCRRLVQASFAAFIWFMKSLGVLTWEVNRRELLQGGGKLVLANHPTLIDIVFLISMIPNACCIVKSALYRNPFTRGPVSRAGYVPNNAPEQLLADCVDELEKGATLVVFPEGTRSVGHRLLSFKRGAAYVWLEARCTVSLVSISCKPPTLAKHEKWHQIPCSRPHFRLAVREDLTFRPTKVNTGRNQGARELTRHWQEHFTREIVT
jgi:1-acyl-sn-glycerol-3-phosphate acyltransferase